ncbi:acylphosphatase [candidate division TA06 bacterium DG_78]|uniref:Acylphosphatase n=1 Tax=candidate division TA06 bacterium DG_78 TaxID=1703772 RepID=A0A0S7YIH5_UNCT6|nr:MAG: acylphosphatase [candidate division TA06 bacterium DG_78]
MKENVRVHLHISGIVQGVFFRSNTREVATNLHVTGWVRNLYDGRVEVVAEGPKDSIDQFIQWCHRGPSGASVDTVEIDWQDATGEFNNFEIRYRY